MARSTPGDAEAVLAGGEHPKALGPVEEIDWFKQQQRLIFARCGVIDPLSLDDYVAHGGGRGLRRAIEIGGAATVKTVLDSGLRGRGGAGFPTGIKWRTVAGVEADQKYVVCNADEGDSGTFADRMLMEGDPFLLIEGMAIAGLAVGATQGYVYIRSEYPHAFATFKARHRASPARPAGSGPNVLGSGKAFDLEARLGAGAYICGEETSLLESLEGKRGLVRAKPPLPAISGLFGKPTVINNVLSFASTPWILDAWRGRPMPIMASGRSLGSQPFQLAGNIKRGGLVELAFGPTIRRLVEDFGGGTRSGRPLRAVQVGGPLGAYFPDKLLDTSLDYEAMAAVKGMLGHGGIVVFDDTRGHGRAGALRHGVLRGGKLRQMHALPHRLDARRRDRRQDHRRRPARGQYRAAARSLRDDARRLALRARRPDALSGAERARPLPRGFRPPPRAAGGGIGGARWRSARKWTPARRSASRTRR